MLTRRDRYLSDLDALFLLNDRRVDLVATPEWKILYHASIYVARKLRASVKDEYDFVDLVKEVRR